MMRKTLANFNYYRSYRLKILEQDDVQVRIINNHEFEDKEHENASSSQFELIDLNLDYLTLYTKQKLQNQDTLSIKLTRKRFLNQWDVFLEGQVMHKYCAKNGHFYAIKIERNIELQYFIKEFINRFSRNRLQNQLMESSLAQKALNNRQGMEIYSMLMQFARLFFRLGQKLNLQKVLREASRLMACDEINLWIINPETNKLENTASTQGSRYSDLDMRTGLLGIVFMSQEMINLKVGHGPDYKSHYREGLESFAAAPILNSKQQCIGVVEFINQLEYTRFRVEHEKIIKLTSKLISGLYYNFFPQSRSSELPEFNDTVTKKMSYLGHSSDAMANERMISKFKYTQQHVHILGEVGSGKTFLANHLTKDGCFKRLDFESVDLKKDDVFDLIGLNWNRPGTVIIENIQELKKHHQKNLYERIKNGQKRVITTSSKDLQVLFESNQFNSKLYHTLLEGLIHLPPLRNRKNDIIDIAQTILHEESKARGLDQLQFSPDSLIKMQEYTWPENLKELTKMIKKALMKGPKDIVELSFPKDLKELDFPEYEIEQLSIMLVQQSDQTLRASQMLKSLEKALEDQLRKNYEAA